MELLNIHFLCLNESYLYTSLILKKFKTDIAKKNKKKLENKGKRTPLGESDLFQGFNNK